MYAQTNAPYPNRIQLVLGPFTGPFIQDGPLGAFDPRRDLQVYVDGALIPVQTFSFDAPNNRYLLYMNQAINLQGVIQVIHHVPSPPFHDASSVLLIGLALIAAYSALGDPIISYLVQEDGTSKFLLEDGLGAILLEI